MSSSTSSHGLASSTAVRDAADREDSFAAVMRWSLPWPLAAVVRWPTSSRRLLTEAPGTILAIIALVWVAWIALWLLEQRW